MLAFDKLLHIHVIYSHRTASSNKLDVLPGKLRQIKGVDGKANFGGHFIDCKVNFDWSLAERTMTSQLEGPERM